MSLLTGTPHKHLTSNKHECILADINMQGVKRKRQLDALMKRADAAMSSNVEPDIAPLTPDEELPEGHIWVIMQHIEHGQLSRRGSILPFLLLDTWVIPGRILEGQSQPTEAQWMATKWQGAPWDGRRIQVNGDPFIFGVTCLNIYNFISLLDRI